MLSILYPQMYEILYPQMYEYFCPQMYEYLYIHKCMSILYPQIEKLYDTQASLVF